MEIVNDAIIRVLKAPNPYCMIRKDLIETDDLCVECKDYCFRYLSELIEWEDIPTLYQSQIEVWFDNNK